MYETVWLYKKSEEDKISLIREKAKKNFSKTGNYPEKVLVRKNSGISPNTLIEIRNDNNKGTKKIIPIKFIEDEAELDLPQVGSNKAILYYTD